MSIFDLYDNSFLPGDKSRRRLREGILEYEHYNKEAEGEEIFEEKSKSLWIPYLSCFFHPCFYLGR